MSFYNSTTSPIQSSPGGYRYCLGQRFYKNQPPHYPEYLIRELRYGHGEWDPFGFIMKLSGDYGTLAFQGPFNAPLIEIGFSKSGSEEIIIRPVSEIDGYQDNRQLIFI